MPLRKPQDSFLGSEDVVPLVSSTTAENDDTASDISDLRQRRQSQSNTSRQRLQSLELYMQRQDSMYQTTCLGDSWRFVASVLLGSCMFGLLIVTHYRNSSFAWSTFDSLQCTHDLSISYSDTFGEIQEATSYCKPQAASCSCTCPLVAKAAVDDSQYSQWKQAFERNADLVQNSNDIDVVLLGDSITEHWQGTSMGRQKYPEIHEVYKDLFRSPNGIQGLALGISGDRCPQVLYRLKHGEFVNTAKLWWLLIGTNDLVSGDCSVEAVLVGTLEIVRSILEQNQKAIVVVNGILPRSPLEDLWKDIHWINERLQCFTQGNDRLHYFNATDIFLGEDGKINKTLMPDMLHPSAEGSRLWGIEIVNQVKQLLGK